MHNNNLLNELNDWTTETLHNAINNSFKHYNLKDLKLQTYTDKIINLLSELPSIDTFKFLKIIDTEVPGLSFHFIIENINFVYQNSKLCYKKYLFSFRASYYMACFPEQQMLAPMRTRLCQALLFSDIDKNFFLDFQQKMQDIQKREFIPDINKKLMKKNLYIEYLENYIHKMTVDSLDDDIEEYNDYECE